MATKYVLYLDESGSFDEHLEVADRENKFASQIAGLLAVEGTISGALCERTLLHAYRAAGLELPVESHGVNLHGESYNQVVEELARQIVAAGWQPVLAVNAESLAFGDKEANYTNMVAELVLRTLEQKCLETREAVELEIVAARYMDDGVQLMQDAYEKRLKEAHAQAAVRRGVAREANSWRIGSFKFESGRRHRALQICDLISNASHSRFRKLPPAARESLKAAIGSYHFTLSVQTELARAEELITQNSLAHAIRECCLLQLRQGVLPEVASAAGRKTELVIAQLASLSGQSRDLQLAVLAAWLEQVVDHARDLELGLRVGRWLTERVAEPLSKKLQGTGSQDTVTWFEHAVGVWLLTASNHKGDILQGQQWHEKLESLLPKLAGRWEYSPQIMRGMIASAVHLTDTYDHDAAAHMAEVVAGFYGNLSSLFADALPGLFPQKVQSDLHGQALGTWLQAEMYRSLGSKDPGSSLQKARELNEQALAQFASTADRQRQHQYRAQLETFAGDFAEARRHLAAGMGLESDTHETLGKAISELDGFAQGFGMLHWFRIGSFAAVARNQEEIKAFGAALKGARLGASPWLTEAPMDYPAHGIRRSLAKWYAATEEVDLALSTLGQLRKLRKEAGNMDLFALIEIAAMLEVAGLIGRRDEAKALRLVDSSGGKVSGANQLLRETKNSFGRFIQASKKIEDIEKAVAAFGASGERNWQSLIGASRAIGY